MTQLQDIQPLLAMAGNQYSTQQMIPKSDRMIPVMTMMSSSDQEHLRNHPLGFIAVQIDDEVYFVPPPADVPDTSRLIKEHPHSGGFYTVGSDPNDPHRRNATQFGSDDQTYDDGVPAGVDAVGGG